MDGWKCGWERVKVGEVGGLVCVWVGVGGCGWVWEWEEGLGSVRHMWFSSEIVDK